MSLPSQRVLKKVSLVLLRSPDSSGRRRIWGSGLALPFVIINDYRLPTPDSFPDFVGIRMTFYTFSTVSQGRGKVRVHRICKNPIRYIERVEGRYGKKRHRA